MNDFLTSTKLKKLECVENMRTILLKFPKFGYHNKKHKGPSKTFVETI